MERQTQAPKVVINASVFLTAVLVDEPADARHGAHRLLQDVITHQADAFVPDRFEDEVLGGLVEAVTKGRPILATPAAIFSALQRFMEVVTIHHRNADWQAEEVFAGCVALARQLLRCPLLGHRSKSRCDLLDGGQKVASLPATASLS
jgi:hypothetical protein